jgi:hypothetical protein
VRTINTKQSGVRPRAREYCRSVRLAKGTNPRLLRRSLRDRVSASPGRNPLPTKPGQRWPARSVFYCRARTKDQRLDLHVDAARRLGVAEANIYVEKASGARHNRPVLARALPACEKGDTFACYKLDRLGRSLVHLTKDARSPRAGTGRSSEGSGSRRGGLGAPLAV